MGRPEFGNDFADYDDTVKAEVQLCPYVPAADWLLIDMEETKYTGTLIIPETAKDAPQSGKVIAVGPGLWDREAQNFDTLISKIGDRVLFAKYAGAETEWEGRKLLLVRESDIVAYIKEDLHG